MSEQVSVEGLAAFRRALKEADGKWPKELGEAHKLIGSVVTSRASARGSALGSTAAHVVGGGGIRPSARTTGVTIVLGGARSPEALGAEFGGGSRPSTRQFKPYLGRTGYFLYPTIRAYVESGELSEAYAEVIDRVAHDAFPD